jgi:hypothetical protein
MNRWPVVRNGTQTPWTVEPLAFGRAHIVGPDYLDGTRDRVASNVSLADAPLLCAAPELYDEAKRLRKLLDDLDRACIQATERGAMMVHIGDLRQLAKAPALDAAIAKAEGRDEAASRA